MNQANELTCASCGVMLPHGALFCTACGHEAGTESSVSTAKSVAGTAMRPAEALGERKTVTIFFADVIGSTSLAERMDPEDWTAIVNRAYERLSPVIHRYDGWTNPRPSC